MNLILSYFTWQYIFEYFKIFLKIYITSNCRQIWRPDQPMSLIVSSILGGVNEQNSIVNKCIWTDDWTAELSTIASNECLSTLKYHISAAAQIRRPGWTAIFSQCHHLLYRFDRFYDDGSTTSSSTDNKVTYRDFKVNYKFYSLRFSILKTVKNRDWIWVKLIKFFIVALKFIIGQNVGVRA